jgi:hypothetical protein
MAIEVGALHLAITAPNTGAVEQSLRKVDKAAAHTAASVTKTNSTLSAMTTAFKGLAIAAGVGLTLRKFVDATSTAQSAQAQLGAALRSTGYAAGQSIQALNEHAAALQAVTTFGDEAINSAQGLLLTFTQIKGDVFPKATEAVLNVAQAMGTDLKSAALQVGKALNDPVAGVNALARSGIQFTAQQKDQIKTLVESGKTVQAQAIILKELEAQFGGSAAAARNTLGGALKSLNNAFGDLFEVSEPGTAQLVRGINDIEKALVDLKGWLDRSDFFPTLAREMGLAARGAVDAAKWFGMLGDLVDANGRRIQGYADVLKGLTLGNQALAASGAMASVAAGKEAKAIWARMEALRDESHARERAARSVDDYANALSGALKFSSVFGTTGPQSGKGNSGSGSPLANQLDLLVQVAAAAPITTREYASLEKQATALNAALRSGNLSMQQRIDTGKQLLAVESALASARLRYTVAETAANFATRVRKDNDALTASPGRVQPAAVDPSRVKMGEQIQPQFDQARAEFLKAMDELAAEMDVALTQSLSSAFASGIENAMASGSLSRGLKALGASMLAGIGNILVQLGTALLPVGKLIAGLWAALKTLNPVAMTAAAVGLIAVGSMMRGIAGRVVSGGGGGVAMVASAPGTIGNLGIGGDTGTGRTAFAGGQRAAMGAQPVTVNATIIGPNDPMAQRQIATLVDNAARRGLMNGSSMRTV